MDVIGSTSSEVEDDPGGGVEMPPDLGGVSGGSTGGVSGGSTGGVEPPDDEPGYCGDGVVDPGELCDDGNAEDSDACTPACVPASCGDGIVQVGVEACDDGNAIDTDACTNACTLAVCGDGVVQAGVEVCDDGNDDSTDACTAACVPAVCGDGVVHAGVEACDDGNESDTDACMTGCVLAVCGDGIVQTGVEICDDGNASNTDFCLDSCVPPSCGDGFVLEGIEACDDGNDDDTDTCTSACALASCGDGIVQIGEACDDGNDDGTDACTNACMPAVCGDGFVLAGEEECDDGDADDNDACLNNCVAAVCGDGVVRSWVEECDDGNDIDNDLCSNACTEAVCGDGIVNLDVEECDDGNTDDSDDCLTSCLLPIPESAVWYFDLPPGAQARRLSIGVDGHVFVLGTVDGAPWVYQLDDQGNEVGSMAIAPAVAGLPAVDDADLSIGTADGVAYVLLGNDARRWVAALDVSTQTHLWTQVVEDSWLPADTPEQQNTLEPDARLDVSSDGRVVLAHRFTESYTDTHGTPHSPSRVYLFELDPATGVVVAQRRFAPSASVARIDGLMVDASRGVLLQTYEPSNGNLWSFMRRIPFTPSGFGATTGYSLPWYGAYSSLVQTFGLGGPPLEEVVVARRVWGPFDADIDLYLFHGTNSASVSSFSFPSNVGPFSRQFLVLSDGDIIIPRSSGMLRVRPGGSYDEYPVPHTSSISRVDSRYEGADSTAMIAAGWTRVVHVTW